MPCDATTPQCANCNAQQGMQVSEGKQFVQCGRWEAAQQHFWPMRLGENMWRPAGGYCPLHEYIETGKVK